MSPTTGTPEPGTFVLHSNAIPDLPAGPYTVHIEQSISAPGAAAEAIDSFLEVTAPRFTLPADQVLSTFPPNQAQGAFSSRLPQIVLKRRTLPWERELDGRLATGTLPRNVPWLALVLLADAECEFRSARPIADCVTPGVVLEGRNDTAVADAIVVTSDVVDQVFPTKAELPLLTHVRQVDLSDTELALGDDDGWLAVVLSNRLPQPGVRYRACLVSLEGQYGELADSAQVAEEFDRLFVYTEAAAQYEELAVAYAGSVDGSASSTAATDHGGIGRAVAVNGSARALTTGTTAAARSPMDAWSTDSVLLQPGSRAVSAEPAPPAATSGFIGTMHVVDMGVIAPLVRQLTFPVLAHWQFTCTGSGDFQSLLQGLDVGMLGTLPPDPAVPAPGEKPPAPAIRNPPEVVDTGHVALGHTSRDGEPGTVWYRGPLVPRPTSRRQAGTSGVLPLLHASDQARRIGPDGRENLSLATAFEIGRLLALAEPSVVAALLNWRKEGFDTSRRTELLGAEPSLSRGGLVGLMAGFAVRAGHELLSALGSDDAARMGRPRPLVEPGRPIPGIDGAADGDPVELIAAGLGLPLQAVRDLVSAGSANGAAVPVPVVELPSDGRVLLDSAEREFAPLRFAVRQRTADIATDGRQHDEGPS